MRIEFILTVGLAATLAACGRGPSPQPIEESQSLQAAQPPADAAAPQNAANVQPQPQPSQSQQPQEGGPAPEQTQPPPQEQAGTQPSEATTAHPSPALGQPGVTPQPQAQGSPEGAQPAAIPAGTALRVRLGQTVGTRISRPGDRFDATLVGPVVMGGQILIPAGTDFHGHIVESKRSGRFKGRAVLGLELDSFALNGTRYSVLTAADFRESGKHKKRNWALIGGGTGLGTALGAFAGGPAGALIGAGAGAAVGTTGAYLTGKKNITLPAETALTFRLRRDVAIR